VLFVAVLGGSSPRGVAIVGGLGVGKDGLGAGNAGADVVVQPKVGTLCSRLVDFVKGKRPRSEKHTVIDIRVPLRELRVADASIFLDSFHSCHRQPRNEICHSYRPNQAG
jgi:hypothetical protein